MRAGIALGSNVGDRLAHLRQAARELRTMTGAAEPFLFSPIFETEPMGVGAGSGRFLNAVAELEYSGHPAELLEGLQTIEAKMGRPSKRPRNAPRTIDLDLLYAGNLVLANSEVVIPHPRLHLRRFVLEPLCRIRPDLQLPGHEATVSELLAGLPPGGGVALLEGLSLV